MNVLTFSHPQEFGTKSLYLIREAVAECERTFSSIGKYSAVLLHLATKTLELNDVGICNFSLDHPVSFDPYQENKRTGSFILINRFANETIGAGMIDVVLR